MLTKLLGRITWVSKYLLHLSFFLRGITEEAAEAKVQAEFQQLFGIPEVRFLFFVQFFFASSLLSCKFDPGPVLLHRLGVLENRAAESFRPANFSAILLPLGRQVRTITITMTITIAEMEILIPQLRILGETYNPASNSSTPRTQTRSRSKVKHFRRKHFHCRQLF